MGELESKVAFVTGGSSGIGLGIARACHQAGMKVAISYRTPEHLRQAEAYFQSRPHDFHAIRLEVTDRRAMSEAAVEIEEKFGQVQLLVNNAGIGIKTPISQASFEEWDLAIDVNLRGVINGVGVFVPRMLAAGQPSHVVSTASMSGLFAAGKAGVYITTKYAIVGMMEALRADLAPHGIGVSAFCPGAVQSHIADWKRQGHGSASGPKPVGMDALECGERVLRGVRENALFILTHPEFREGLEQRCRALLSSFHDEDGQAPGERLLVERELLKSEIYEQELARLARCHSRPESETP